MSDFCFNQNFRVFNDIQIKVMPSSWDNHKILENHLHNHWINFNQTWQKAFFGEGSLIENFTK